MMGNYGLILLLAARTMINIESVYSQKPKLGSAINMLKRYGHLAETMRVISSNTSGTWIYREPSINIFADETEFTDFFVGVHAAVLVLNVRIKFCSNVEELVKEYFCDFQFAGIDQPSRAFNNDWSLPLIAEHFGLGEFPVAHNHSFVLLKVGRARDRKTLFGLPGNFRIDEAVAKEIPKVSIGDSDSADRFIHKFGTHYISSFSTGDFVYQVFVFERRHYRWLKKHVTRRGIEGLSESDKKIYFSPSRALHVGTIRSASGSQSVETWAAENLVGLYSTNETKSYSNLMRIHGTFTLSAELDQVLKDSALLRMELETLSAVFECSVIRNWFDDYIHKRLNETVAKSSND